MRHSLPPHLSKDACDVSGYGNRGVRRASSMLGDSVITDRRPVTEPQPSRRPVTEARPSRRHESSSSSSCSEDRMECERGGIERGQQATEEASSQLSYWYLLKHGYTELVHLIIRPPRTDYDIRDLGPESFQFAGRSFVREDFTVVNDRQQKLVCSLWRPALSSTSELLPCVVYLHGNSSCRLEALGVLRTCLAAGLAVAAFDTAGCGKSDGEYISLGYYERDDLRDVVAYLRATKNVGAVALWGRSMGAATALLHADRDPSIAGIVVDSAFASLEQLVEEVVERGRQEGLTLPGFLVKIVLKFIRLSVKKRAHFNLRRLAPIDHAPVSFVPALIVAAEHDTFIAPHHSDQIFAAYGGDKNLVKVHGGHNSSRPKFLLDSAAIFLQTALQVDAAAFAQSSAFIDGITGGGRRVPWEGAVQGTSSLSICSSSASSYRLTMELDTRHSGNPSMIVPMESWSCTTCTFVNRSISMQCVICRAHYVSDGEAEQSALSARRRALTSGDGKPLLMPSFDDFRRRSLDAMPLATSAQSVAPTKRARRITTAPPS